MNNERLAPALLSQTVRAYINQAYYVYDDDKAGDYFDGRVTELHQYISGMFVDIPQVVMI